jgi:hypothetical protein
MGGKKVGCLIVLLEMEHVRYAVQLQVQRFWTPQMCVRRAPRPPLAQLCHCQRVAWTSLQLTASTSVLAALPSLCCFRRPGLPTPLSRRRELFRGPVSVDCCCPEQETPCEHGPSPEVVTTRRQDCGRGDGAPKGIRRRRGVGVASTRFVDWRTLNFWKRPRTRNRLASELRDMDLACSYPPILAA